MSAENTEPEAKADAALKSVQEAFAEWTEGNKPICPHCGRCPVCGRGGLYPWSYQPYDPQPTYYLLYKTWTAY